MQLHWGKPRFAGTAGDALLGKSGAVHFCHSHVSDEASEKQREVSRNCFAIPFCPKMVLGYQKF